MMNLLRISLLAAAIAPAIATAAPFTSAVANDSYSLAKGGSVNGIATANDNNDSAPDLYQAVNKLIGTSYSHNWQLDDRFVAADEMFKGTGDHSIVLVGLAASNANTLGIYTDAGVGANKTSVIGPESGFFFSGEGSAANPFKSAQLTISGDFGWYLDSRQWSTGTTLTYYSEAALNGGSSGLDHMMTFRLDELNGQSYFLNDGSSTYSYTFENALLIGWEDLPLAGGKLGDEDYDDIMYLIDFRSIPAEVPAPASVLLFAVACAGLSLSLRRRRK